MDIDVDEIINEANLKYGDGQLGQREQQAGKAGDIKALMNAWTSERMAPEILSYESDLVERVLAKIQSQIEYMDAASENPDSNTKLTIVIIQMELERVKFLVRSYLRARIHKIDRYALHLLKTPTERSKLSRSEIQHQRILNRHFTAWVLKDMPEKYRAVDDETGTVSMVEQPDLEDSVFCQVLRDIPQQIYIDQEYDSADPYYCANEQRID